MGSVPAVATRVCCEVLSFVCLSASIFVGGNSGFGLANPGNDGALAGFCTTLFDAIKQSFAGSLFTEADEIHVNSRMKQARRVASGHTNWYKESKTTRRVFGKTEVHSASVKLD